MAPRKGSQVVDINGSISNLVLMQLKNGLQDEILSEIEAIEKDEKLYDEKNFNLRSQAIDDIEFHVIDRIDALIGSADEFDQLAYLKQYATKVKCDLEAIDARMFHQLRTKISHGGYRGPLLMDLMDEYLDHHLNLPHQQDAMGYDHLDLFFNGLLNQQDLPIETKEQEAEMVYYQKTPARIILELVKRAVFEPQDVFFDLGSGLGQVVILVNLLTGVRSTGIEFESAFCKYAKACATGLNLNDVEFINTDARDADYSLGTVFFMYTPFKGEMLGDVLQKLHDEAKKRRIKIFTYGPCTHEVSEQNWLVCSCNTQYSIDALYGFTST